MSPLTSPVGPISRLGSARYRPYTKTARRLSRARHGTDSLQACADPSGGHQRCTPTSILYDQSYASSSSSSGFASSPCQSKRHARAPIRSDSARRKHKSSAGTLESIPTPEIEETFIESSTRSEPQGPTVYREKASLAFVNEPHSRELVDQAVSLLEETWLLPHDSPFPPGYLLPGHERAIHISLAARQQSENPDTAEIAMDRDVLAARAAIDAERMLTPPEQASSEGAPGSPSSTDYSPTSPVSDYVSTQEAPDDLPLSSPEPSLPTGGAPLSQAQPSAPLGESSAFDANTSNNDGGPSILSPMEHHQISQSLRFFVHEILRRSATSCRTLEIAMCYLGALRKTVSYVLRERQKVLSHAQQMHMSVSDADERGIFGTPVGDARRMFLSALVLATKFHQDRSYSNRAWSRLSGLSAKEVTRCEKALGNALEWRLWVGRILPVNDVACSAYESNQIGLQSSTGQMLQGCANCIDNGGPIDTTPGIVAGGRCLSPPPTNIPVDVLEWEGYQEDVQILNTACPSCVDAALEGRDQKTLSFIANSTAAEECRQREREQKRIASRERKNGLQRATTSLTDGVPSRTGTLGRTRSLPTDHWVAQTVEPNRTPIQRAVYSSDWTENLLEQPAAPCLIDHPSFSAGFVGPALVQSQAGPESASQDMVENFHLCSSPAQSEASSTCVSGISTPKTFVETASTSYAPFMTSRGLPLGSAVGAYRPPPTPAPRMVIPVSEDHPGWYPPNESRGFVAMTPPRDFRMLYSDLPAVAAAIPGHFVPQAATSHPMLVSPV